jgi:flagellar protein FlbD
LALIHTLIKVTRLNGKPFIINAVYIETVESFPDTTITLTNGRKFVVKETEEKIMQLVTKFYQTVNLLGQQQLEEIEDEE